MSVYDDCAESLTTDQTFDLLGDGTRRRALTALQAADGAMALGELAEETVAQAEDAAPEAVPADRRKRIAASLHHCHLPKLDDAGVVAYDPSANLVEASGGVEQLEPYFELIASEQTASARSD
jgi:hypothetical protein